MVLSRVVEGLMMGLASTVQLAAVAAIYLGLVVATVYVTEMELRLPLIYYRSRAAQVCAAAAYPWNTR